jgi:hypothetical protein
MFKDQDLQKVGGSYLCDKCKTKYISYDDAKNCNCYNAVTPKQLEDMYKKGGLELIMKKLNVSRPTACKALDEAGVERNKKRGNPNITKKIIIKGV